MKFFKYILGLLFLFVAPVHAIQYINSVQHFSITIANTNTTGTTTINSVDTTKSIIIFGGFQCGGTTTPAGNMAYLELTNGTTVTAVRQGTPTSQVIVTGCVIECTSSLLTSVQRGLITIASGTSSNTATVSSVNANSSLVNSLYYNTNDSTLVPNTQYPRLSISGTTVTAQTNANTTSDLIVSYQVIEFNPSALNSNVQTWSASFSGGTSSTTTISNVDVNNSFIFLAGSTTDVSTANSNTTLHRTALTNGTTVTFTTDGATGNEVVNGSIVEFAAGVLKSSVQRGSITVNGVTSNTATLSTAVTTTTSMIGWQGFTTSNTATLNRQYTNIALTDSTTVTATKQTATAGGVLVGYAVAEFSTSSSAPVDRKNGMFELLLGRIEKNIKRLQTPSKELALAN